MIQYVVVRAPTGFHFWIFKSLSNDENNKDLF